MRESNRRLLTYLAMLGMIVPFVVLAKQPETWTAESAALYFGSISGFVGVVLLLWQFILGTRTVSALLYKDLSWSIKLHKFLGKWGVLAVFIHPLLIMYSYGEELLYILLPSFKTDFETAVSWGRFAIILLVVIWVSSAILRGKIKFRPWKYVHYGSYLILPLVFLHSPPIGTALATSEALFAYWYGLVLLFIFLATLRARHFLGVSKSRFEVVENRALNTEIQLLRLKPIGRPRAVERGQYVYLQKKLLGEEHPFTVLDSKADTGELHVAYKALGSFTRAIRSHLLPGAMVLVDGPYGVFTKEVSSNDRPPVYIAGGVGITPFVSHILNRNQRDDYLFYATKNKQSAVFEEELRQKLGDRMVSVYSQSSGGKSTRLHSENGHISSEVIAKHLSDPVAYNYFICGPAGMMDHVKQQLAELNVPKEQVFSEEFGF